MPQEGLWLRGLLPQGVVLDLPPPKHWQEVHVEPGGQQVEYQGEVCTDGSGGHWSAKPTLRRCGWAAAQLSHASDDAAVGRCPQFVAFGALPGAKQTSARAELFALAHVVAHLVGNTTIWTDHEAIVRIFRDRPSLHNAEFLEHGDLWRSIQQSIASSPHHVTVKWINSHADVDLRDHGIGYNPEIPREIYKGNDSADIKAKEGARLHDICQQVADQQIEFEMKTERVLRRLVVLAIEATRSLGDIPKREPKPITPRASIQQRLDLHTAITEHTIVRLANSALHCTRCFSRSSAQRKLQVDWLAMPCVTNSNRKDSFGTKPHHSHHLSQRADGLIWCRACGCWSGRIYRALKKKCLDHPKSGLQRLALDRFAKGLDPPGLDCGSMVMPPAVDQPTELCVEGLESE